MRCRILVSLGSILLPSIALWVSPTFSAAQQATPSPTVAAEIAKERLAQAPLGAFLPTPATVLLARLTLDPGASLPMDASPGPVLHYVEAGAITVRVDGPATVMRNTTATPTVAQPPATQTADTTLVPGDLLVVSAAVPSLARNAGQGIAITISVAILPPGSPAPWSSGAATHLLVGGIVTASLPGPAVLALTRLTYAPESRLSTHPHPGPELLYVESGALGLSVVNGEGRVTRAVAAGTPDAGPMPRGLNPPGMDVIASAGEGVFIQPGTVASTHNAADTPCVVLALTVFSAEGQAPS